MPLPKALQAYRKALDDALKNKKKTFKYNGNTYKRQPVNPKNPKFITYKKQKKKKSSRFS